MQAFIIFLVVLSALVIIHELGHFITARAFGIKVLEFGIGYPPKIFGLRWGKTIYSLNILPLGGFVKLLGEEDSSHPNSLASKGILTRSIVIGSGAMMNLILPIILFTVVFAVPKETIVGLVQISEVNAGSPAEKAGLQAKDIIINVDGHAIHNTGDLAYRLQLKLGGTSNWIIQRGTDTKQISLVPRWRPPMKEGPTGITVRMIMQHWDSVSYPFFKAVSMGIQRTGETLILVRNEVTKWIIGSAEPILTGPIGIAQATGEVARVGGIMPLIQFAGLLSINLAILNILPIPMLDGGKLMFLGIELLRRGKKIPPEKEGLVHLIGFTSLILFAVVVSYFDILRIMRGESIIG